MKFFLALFGFSLCLVSSSSLAVRPSAHFKKVIMVFFENMDYSAAIKSPTMKKLADQGVLFDNFFAETHPSQGNYIAITAGSDYGVHTDSNVDLSATHIGDQLESHGMNWRVYAEDYPGNCFTGAKSGLYARKHNPFMSFMNVTRNSQRCANVMDAKNVLKDFASGSFPEFTFWVPNTVNDGHDHGIKDIDAWVNSTLSKVVQNSDLLKDTLLVLTFDEGGYLGNNQVYTVAIGAGIAPKTVNHQSLHHPDILAMIQTEFGFEVLPNQDAGPAITGLWNN